MDVGGKLDTWLEVAEYVANYVTYQWLSHLRLFSADEDICLAQIQTLDASLTTSCRKTTLLYSHAVHRIRSVIIGTSNWTVLNIASGSIGVAEIYDLYSGFSTANANRIDVPLPLQLKLYYLRIVLQLSYFMIT